MQSLEKHAQDLVFAILEANRTPGAQPADLFAVAQRFLDTCAAAERERCARVLSDTRVISSYKVALALLESGA